MLNNNQHEHQDLPLNFEINGFHLRFGYYFEIQLLKPLISP